LAVAEGTWFLATVFLAVELVVDAAVTFLAFAPVRVGLATVVPEEVEDETLPRRSSWRVAGRGKGDRVVVLPAVAALLAGLLDACEAGLLTDAIDGVPFVERRRAFSRDPARLDGAALSGLEGFSDGIGRERYGEF
jgi:hypothetical protein